MPLTVSIYDDYNAMSRAAARAALDTAAKQPEALLSIATGASPEGLYRYMAEEKASLQAIRLLKLDEWGGVSREDPSTCETFIREHIIAPWGIEHNLFDGFDPETTDPMAECRRIQRRISDMGGIDLAILGMGADGHIGLNYPAADLPAFAHPTGPETLRHGMLEAALIRPTFGMTLGMAEILAAREILLVVSGKSKAAAVARMLSGRLSTEFPASLLLLHGTIHCFLDTDAASLSEETLRGFTM